MAGSIQKRGTNSYYLTYSKGYDSKGKRIRYTKTIKAENDREAEKELAIFISEIEKGQVIQPTKMTFQEFTDKWLNLYAKGNLAPKTLHRYEEMLNSRIIPAIGHIRLEKLRPDHLLQFYVNLGEDGIRKDKKKGGLAPRTILHHHALISAMLEDAVEWGYIPFNPASRVKPPKVEAKEAKYYDLMQTLDLLIKLEDQPIKYKLLVSLELLTGIREGEITGLEWGDFDYAKKTITISRASQYVPGQGIITKPPKNPTSIRTIALPDCLMPLIWEYEEWQVNLEDKMGDLWHYSSRIFTKQNGEPMFPNTPSCWFHGFLKSHNLPPLNFHGLRHTNASILIGEGLDIKSVSERLGHSKTSTTLNIYIHLLREVDRNSANILQKLFGTYLKKME